jgi:hypothetical protein
VNAHEVTSAREWLDARGRDVPPSLHRRMLDAIAATDGSTGAVPLQLAAAAMTCVREATACGNDRSAAIHLLAADALMTDAVELAAGDAVMLDRIVTEYAPAAIAGRLAAAGKGSGVGGAP